MLGGHGDFTEALWLIEFAIAQNPLWKDERASSYSPFFIFGSSVLTLPCYDADKAEKISDGATQNENHPPTRTHFSFNYSSVWLVQTLI